MSINKWIDSVVKCVVCKTQGVGNCNCWDQCAHGYRHETKGECECTERCSCGWFHYPGVMCFNPKTKACTSRVKFGKYNRKIKRYE